MRIIPISDFVKIIKLSLPILVSQFSFVGFSIIDNMISGHYSTLHLAAVGLGSSIWLPFFWVGESILLAAIPLISKHNLSSGDTIRSDMSASAILAGLLIGLLFCLVLQHSYLLLCFMKVPQDLANLSDEYLKIIGYGFPFLMVYQALRTIFDAHQRTFFTMMLALCALMVKIPLSILFVHGWLFFPSLGGAGCAWSTFVVTISMLLLMVIYMQLKNQRKFPSALKKIIYQGFLNLPKLFKLGIPEGINIFFTSLPSALPPMFLSSLSILSVASYEISMSIHSFFVTIPFSFGIATTIMISHAIGNKENVFDTVKITLMTIIFSTLIITFILANFFIRIVYYYTDDINLISITHPLIFTIVILYVTETFKLFFDGILLGYEDTLYTMSVSLLSSLLISLSIGYMLGMTDIISQPMGSKGFLIGIAFGFFANNILLIIRLKLNNNQLKLVG